MQTQAIMEKLEQLGHVQMSPLDSTEDRTKLRGQIIKLFFSSPTFSAGKIRTTEGFCVSFSGQISVRNGEQVVLNGKYKHHPKYGWQFEADNIEMDLVLDTYGLARYIAGNSEIKGIGPVKADIIAHYFEENSEIGSIEDNLQNNPEIIAKIAKVPVTVIENLRDVWMKDRENNAVAVWLNSFGLTACQVKWIMKTLGNSAKTVLTENPYVLTGMIPGFGFKRIDIIALRMGVHKEHPGRIQAGIKDVVHTQLNEGHCWIERTELIQQANILLILDCLDSLQRIENELNGLLQPERILDERDWTLSEFSFPGATPGAMPVKCIGFKNTLENEYFLFDFFSGVDRNPYFIDDFDEIIKCGLPSRLDEDQKAAVRHFLYHRISLITGGAGAGKTYVIKTLLDICEDYGLSVALCAPTGKAAQRMQSSSGRDAATIHRLLEFSPKDGFQVNSYNPLNADVLIVDEVSMLDIDLATALFDAVEERTAVVLVGDHNQLPPVGAGNLLRDIIASQRMPVTFLRTIHRNRGLLKENCNLLLQGKVAATVKTVDSEPSPWFILHESDPDKIISYLEAWFSYALEQWGYDVLNDVQLLTPTHKGPLGTKNLNAVLQKLIQAKKYGVLIENSGINSGINSNANNKNKKTMPVVYYKGDRVIQTKNDYDNLVFNGTIGIVTGFDVLQDEDGNNVDAIMVKFETKEEPIPLPKTGNALQLAYALTIHKAQGSEFPAVICVVHKSHSYQHHRNLFYTAVTRAQQTAVIIGDVWGIRNCAHKIHVDDRRTFFSLLHATKLMGENANANTTAA